MKLPKMPKRIMDHVPSWIPEPIAEVVVLVVGIALLILVLRFLFAVLDAAFASILALGFLAIIGVSLYWVYDKYIKPKDPLVTPPPSDRPKSPE